MILGQIFPSDSDNHLVYSGSSKITKIFVTNTGAASSFRIFFGEGGEPNENNAIAYDKAIDANEVIIYEIDTSSVGMNIHVRSADSDRINFTVLGEI